MGTPLDQLADCLYTFEDEQAFCIDHRFYTYGQLRKMTGSIQAALLKCSPGNHANIGIVTYNDLETYASVLAVLYAGHAFVPVNPLHPDERNSSILDQSKISIVLSSRTEASDGLFAGKEMVLTSTLSTPAELIRVPLPEEQHAYILFTSGTTGKPKGVPISVQNLNSFLDAFFSLHQQIDNRDRFVQMFDLTFDLSIMSYMAPLCIGACVYTVPFEGIKYTYIYTLLEKYNITFALLVPSILTNLRKYFPEIHLPEMKYSLFCGEALYEDVALEWSKCIRNAVIQNVYGPTEATIFCMAYTLIKNGNSKSANGIVSIGKPMKGTEVLIVNDAGHPVSAHEKGELCLGGLQVTRGYFDEQQNKKAFFNFEGGRYYKTGDLCFQDEDGDVFFSGRSDFQVKVNGFRVELAEIEFHAREFLNMNAVVAHAVTDAIATHIYLFVEGAEGPFDAVHAYLKTKMPAYMIPEKYVGVKQFPQNANGKVDRKALMNMIA